METPMKANTSEEDLYGDLDEMFLRQSDGETTQTSEGVILSTSHSGAYTTSQADSEYSNSDTVVDDMNDLDLYDDLIVEEGQQRIESLQEMIKKYEEALTLKNKLEAENQALRELVSKKESATKDMQKNFSSLLITAKGEINRKDRELNSLRRRLSSSPVPALSKYRIPRKSLQDVSSSLESDFDPLYVSSPSRQRPGARTSFNKEFKGIDTPSRLERSTVDSRKKHDADNNDTDRSRVESLDEEEPARTHKYSKIHKGLRSTETYFAEMKGKCDTKNTSQDARSEKSRQNNEQIGEVDVSQKFTDGQQTCRINNDRLRNDSFKEISKRIERRESGESVSEDRKKLSKETNVKIRDDKCEISGTKDLGKDMKKIDLREKLRQKRLEKQSGHNADTVESTVEQDSAENSFMFGSSARDKQNIKLKRIEDKPLCTDHSSLSIFQRKREKKNLNWSKQNEDLSAEKEFLEKLKTTVKKTESSCPYNTKNLTCSDKVTNTVTEGKTQDNSVREIRSYSDINPEMSDPESIINTEIVATNDEYFSATSSESYFSASDYPCNKSTSKTKLLSKDKKTSIEMSENDLSVENGTKKTFVKDLDRMEADSNLTKKNDKQDIHGCEKKIDTENDLEIDNYKHDSPVKNSSILKESEHRRENSQAEKGSFQAYVDRCDQVNTCKEGELIDTESDSKKSQNSSDCNTEMEMRQKCLKKDAENDNLELLRRSARLASKSDSSVSLCKSAIDIRKGEKTKKCVQNENIDNNVSKEEMDMAQKIFIGNTKSVDTRRKKRRIHRSVTSETISSVTLVDMSESFSSVSEEIDDSSQSTENTSTSDDFQSLDKNEKSQKWVCTNRNCTIRMRHLHPKCHEPNLIGEKNKKDSQEVISEGIDSQKDISEGKNADENKKLDSLASNKTDKMEVNDWEFEIPENNSLSSEGKMKSQSIEPELVKDNSMLNVSNGTVELAKAESDSSSSSFSSESELSSEGSRSLSDSSASSESSDESGSETVNQDTPVMAVVADKKLVKKSPVPSTKITEMSVTGNKEHCSKPGISVTSNNQKKKSEVENSKGKNSSSLLENTGTFSNKNLNDEGIRCTVKSLLSVPSETKGRNEKEKHSKKQFEVGREEVLHSKEQKTKSMDKINDKSKVENNRGSDICKGTLQSEDKTVNSNDFNNTLSAKDSIQIEVKEAAEPIECYEQDTAKMVKNTNAVGKNASNDGKFALNIDHVDKCNKSSSSGTNTHELSNVIKHIDQVSETVTCGSSESALQHLKNCDVKDDKETLDKHEISESESEGSFGSNIMSERTGSSLTDDECEYSDSDNSSGSSYTDESSYSSSDESGSGSSWDSSSSYSDSEYDGDAEVKALPEAKSKASGENKQLVSNISCQEKTCVKEARMAGEDFPTTPFNSTNDTEELLTEKSALDKHDFEIAGENQQKDGSVHHDKNEMEVDEETSNACQNQKNHRFENKCLKEKTVLEKNMPEKKGSVAKCSKNVSPKRSNLLQTLLKCVEIDLKGQKPVTEINKDESKIEKFLIPTTKNTDNTKTNEEFLIDKAIVNRSENCFHEKKQTIQKKAISVENVDQVTQTKSSKMLEMDLCDENDRHVSEILQLDVREITKKYKSSKSVSINYEKGKSCNKAEKSHQDTVASSEDVGGCVSKKEEYVKSNDKSMSHSGTKKRGQKLNEISQENIFGSTSSLSDTSDSEDSSSWSRSHSSGCSTCLSDSGSATDIESVIPAESEKNCNQKSKTVGLANVKNLKNECEKLNKTEEIDIYINCETAECRGAANEVRSEKSNTLVNNTGCETVSLKPCVNNPYWIADEIPEFLSSTENKENQYKKSPSSNSTSSGDTKPLTPAVKFVKLNMSPSQMQAISPDKRFSLSPNTGNDAKSASAVDNHIGVISSVIDKSNLSKRSQQDNDTDPGNKEKSPAPGSSKDCHNHGRTSLAPRNLKETRGGMTNNTNRHKYSDGKNLESELSNQKKENKCNTNSIRSQNLRVKSSKGMNLKSKDVNIEEVKSKKFEKCPLRRSPRKKPSNTSVTDLKAKGKTNEKNEKKQHMTKIQISDSSTSKTGEHNLNVKYVKSAERLNNLKSVGKITVISKSSDDVSKTKERSSKQSSSPCQKEKESKNKQVSSCNENRRKESMKDSKVASKIMECEQAETRKGTPMMLDISEAKDKVSCSKNSSEDKAVSFGKMSVRDTTKILSEKIMKLKVEKNMLEKELKEKQRQEHVQLKMKITLPKTSEVKSGKDAKENMLEGIVLKSGSSRSGKSKPMTVGLAADGSEHLKSKSYNKHTGSLNKYETLTFEEKLTSDVGYLSKSKSADKVSKKNHKQICLIAQTASLKAFTIPKVTKGKQCSSQLKNDKIVTKSRSESSAERNTDKSSECIKEKICNQSTYFKEQKKGDSKSDNTQKKPFSKMYITKNDSESSESNNDNESDSRSSEEDNDALVKAVFGSSDSSGNSGKSLTLDDLCKTRSSEDTDDIVRDNIDADTRNSGDVKEIRGNERTLSKECAEITKLKSKKSHNHSKCFDQPQKIRSGKYTSESKSSDVKSKHSIDVMECSNTDKDHSVGKSTSAKQGQNVRSASTNGEKSLRKSPRIQALESPLKSFPHQNERLDSNYKEAHLKENKRLNRTPQECDQEIMVCQNKNEARYFELSHKNSVLNKIISPKKPNHPSQPENEDILTKKTSNFMSETNESEKPTRKSVPLLLLEECTLDGIDYHDDVIYDSSIGEAAESEESSEEELNNKERSMKKLTDSDSDQSVEDGEVSESDEENVTNKSGQENLKGTSQTCNKMTPRKFKMFSKGRLSPVKFPSNETSCDTDSACKCAKRTCIHKRLGVSDMKQTKRYRSDSDSCSDTSSVRPKRRMKYNHSSTRKQSRSYDKTDNQRNRRQQRFLDNPGRSVSPRNRILSGSKSPQRYRKHSGSRLTSTGRRRRSRSCSQVRSRPVGKDYRTARSRHRYRDEADSCSPRRHQRNRSYSGDTSTSSDRSYCGKNNRCNKNTLETTEKSSNQSNLKKTRSNKNNGSGSENKRIETLQEKCFSGASAANINSSDEENERFSKLKSEKCTGKKNESESVRRAGRNRDHCRRNKSYTLVMRFRSRSRSPSRKRKRYVSGSESETDSNTKRKRDGRQQESKSPRKQRHKRSKTDKYSKDNLYEKKEKS